MTRCALPVASFDGLSSPVFEHFGRTEDFAVIEAEEAQIKSVSLIRNQVSYGSADKNLPDFLADNRIDVVLAGMMGTCMSTPLLDRGIKVYTGAEGTVQSAFKQYLAGELEEVKKSRYTL